MISVRRKRAVWFAIVLAAWLLHAHLVVAQTPPSRFLDQFRAARINWFNAVSGPAKVLFGILAVIEFAFTAALLLLEKSDFYSWTAGMVRKIMWIGAFYTLLVFGPTWIPAIIDSFQILGQRAAATGPLAPGDVFVRGLELAGLLFKGASDAGFFTNFASAMALVFAALMTFLAFLAVTIQFVVAMVESYVVVGAGFIFLGFGGSRWTAPYVERYIGLAVSIGVKIMMLYLLIGLGMSLSDGWVQEALNVPTAANPAMSALNIVGSALIFTALCWQAPKLISSVLGGSPALTGGDLAGTVTAVTAAAYLAGAGLTNAARSVAAHAGMGSSSTSQAAGLGTGGHGGGTPGGPQSSAGSSGTPHSGPPNGAGGGGSTTGTTGPAQPAPPGPSASVTQQPTSVPPPNRAAHGMAVTGSHSSSGSAATQTKSGETRGAGSADRVRGARSDSLSGARSAAESGSGPAATGAVQLTPPPSVEALSPPKRSLGPTKRTRHIRRGAIARAALPPSDAAPPVPPPQMNTEAQVEE